MEIPVGCSVRKSTESYGYHFSVITFLLVYLFYFLIIHEMFFETWYDTNTGFSNVE